MTGILISVLAPVVLLGWWAVIVTCSRDNEVISWQARARIRLQRAIIRMTFDGQSLVRDVTAAFAAVAPVMARASKAMQEMRAPMAKIKATCDDGGGEGG